MRNLSDMIARMTATGDVSAAGVSSLASGSTRLVELRGFGSNPGALRGYTYVPTILADAAALVVVLHGCTQSAVGYDIGSGWSQLADRYGFAVLFPEQQRANNPNLCFNWFAPDDIRRGSGEALSIRQMVGAVLAGHALDPAKVFVTGLSAGGAMTAAMLSTYPDVFAGGAIIAGLPYGCALTVPQALDRMRAHGMPDAARLVAKVRAASEHRGPWPTLSVWHGSADATVNAANADAVVAQWRGLHGIAAEPGRRETVDGHARRRWYAADGRAVIEQYDVAGMGHGTPLATGRDGCGKAGPHMLEAGISSSRHICDFWDLAPLSARAAGETAAPDAKAVAAEHSAIRDRTTVSPVVPSGGVGKVIEEALRAAGLMR